MADPFSKKKRSWVMSRIKGKDTKPEVTVRSYLHRLGYRFRVHRSDLPGKPDLVLPKYKTVIFVHGCFWHQHEGCRRATQPKSNREYWGPKLDRNINKFKEDKKALKKEGWKVFVIWECETKKPHDLEVSINNIFYRGQ